MRAPPTLLTIIFAALLPLCAAAQQPLSIHHALINPGDLPDPGAPLTIQAVIANTKDVNMRFVGIFTIDGHLVTVPTTRASLNRYDEAVYEISIPAPIASMSYEFVLHPPEGSPIVSPKFGVSRPCTPRPIDGFPDIDSIADGSERMRLLIEKSQALNTEIERYERVLNMLDEIESLKGDGAQ